MKTLISLFAILGFVSFAQANHIGPAGCGLGNVMFGKKSQILAATTNGSTYTQMFGITSGTSNCDEHATVAKLDAYVEANQVALETDIARGSGETVAGLSNLLRCQNTDSVKSSLKENYSVIYPNQNPSAVEVSNSIRQVLKNQNVGCAI